MNRKELQAEFESVLEAHVREHPCMACGGDPWTLRYGSRMAAFYLYELVKSYKFSEGVDMEKAKERAEKRTAKFFADLSTRELEELLSTAAGEVEMPEPSTEDAPHEEPAAEAPVDQGPETPSAVEVSGPEEVPPADTPESQPPHSQDSVPT